jgi:hypothetical protein
MTDNTYSETITDTVKIVILGICSFIFHNYHLVAGNIFITLSCLYLLWKWRRDYLKEQNVKDENVD